MKIIVATLISACMLGLIGTATAAPIETEINGTKVIVIRPADQWTPNQDLLDNYDAGLKKKKYNLLVHDKAGKYSFSNSSNITGWQKVAADDIAAAGWEASGWLPKNVNIIAPPVTMTGTQFNGVIGVQERYYKALVAKVGPPETQRSAFNRSVLAGYVLAISTLGLGAKMGLPTELLGLTTGLAEGVGTIPPALLSAVSPNWPASGDFSQYPTVDVRQVSSQINRGLVGQIITAYKDEKTSQSEEEAMAWAARALVGVDASLDDFEKGRAEDYDRRLTIWNECVAAGKCTNEH